MLKIHDKLWYVISSKQSNDLSYMTYYEDNSAFRKRMRTGLSWAKFGTGKQDDGHVIDNNSVSGFEICESVSRWSTQNKVFRIKDPRGFVVEVPSGNIPSILSCTTVVNGIIQEECIWARQGQDHILLPVTSKPYQEAVINTEKSKQKIKPSEIEVGEIVELSSYGSFSNMVYLGQFKGTYTGEEIKRSYSLWSTNSPEIVQDFEEYTEKKWWRVFCREDQIKDAFDDSKNIYPEVYRTPNIVSRSGDKVEKEVVEQIRGKVRMYGSSDEAKKVFQEMTHRSDTRVKTELVGRTWK